MAAWDVVELRPLRQLEEENALLERIVADLTLDKQMLQRHLKLHRMKTNTGTLVDILGDLASFKWARWAETLFSLTRRR